MFIQLTCVLGLYARTSKAGNLVYRFHDNDDTAYPDFMIGFSVTISGSTKCSHKKLIDKVGQISANDDNIHELRDKEGTQEYTHQNNIVFLSVLCLMMIEAC